MKDENKKAGAFVNIETEQQGPADSTDAAFEQAADSVKKSLRELMQPVLDAILSEDFQELLQDAEANAEALTPHIEKVLQNPKYKGITAAQVLDNINILGKAVNPDDLTAEILKRAQKRRRAEDARRSQKAGLEIAIPGSNRAIHYAPRENETKLSTTKLAASFFDPFPEFEQVDGQLQMPVDYMSGKKEAVLTATFYADREFLKTYGIHEIDLDYGYGYFVMSTLDQMFYEGNTKVTLSQILKRMGIPASQKEIEKLARTLLTGFAISTIINNKSVLDAWGIDTKNYKEIIGRVMPISIDKEISRFDGNLSKMTITIENASPFYRVSEPLKHLTSWDNKLFELYSGRKTTKYWRVMRYLTKEIAWMRNDKGTERSQKLKLETIYTYVGDKNSHQRQATKALVWELLQSCFAKLHYIDSTKTIEEPATGAIMLKPINNEQRNKILLKEQQDAKRLKDKNQK